MSLTSYRAAPPRVTRSANGIPCARPQKRPGTQAKKDRETGRSAGAAEPRRRVKRKQHELGRPGSDLLSRVLRQSTIGAGEFHGRVRNGIGWGLPARPPDRRRSCCMIEVFLTAPRIAGMNNESNQANRAISTGKLHTLLRFHTRPINVVVFHGSQGRICFEAGFPLRCFQRLSIPYVATLQCGWRHNRSTRGTSIPVLSY